jgi:hypothetical protein
LVSTTDHVALIAWQIIGCILVADFLTGLVHWFEDTYLVPMYPVIGKWLDKRIVEPNISHHIHPTWMVTMGTVLGRNVDPFVLSTAVVSVMWLACHFILGIDLAWWVYATAFFMSLGNEIHSWTHNAKPNRVVRFLHETAIVITPRHHNLRHHRPPFDQSFCTLTNIMNPILDGIGFWRALEWCIGLAGHQAKEDVAREKWCLAVLGVVHRLG